MIQIGERITLAGATGAAAYAAAAICCGLAWARAKSQGSGSRLAASVIILEGFLLLDLILNLRWRLHDFLAGKAMHLHLYGVRRGPQTLALFVLAGLLCLSLLPASVLLRQRTGAFFAVFGASLSLILWCTEVISLHAVDHVLYHNVGPLTVVSLVRICVCLITSAGILIEGRRDMRVARLRPL